MDDKTAWDLYFANLTAMRFHPKNDAHTRDLVPVIAWCAHIASKMVEQRNRTWPPGSQQERQSSEVLSPQKDRETPTK